jgi:hypothetical protein
MCRVSLALGKAALRASSDKFTASEVLLRPRNSRSILDTEVLSERFDKFSARKSRFESVRVSATKYF